VAILRDPGAFYSGTGVTVLFEVMPFTRASQKETSLCFSAISGASADKSEVTAAEHLSLHSLE